VDELLDDARASPDDDAPRLVWADAIGGERGELVVLQCDLARGDLPPDAIAARKRRQRELLDRHGPAWSGLAGMATRCTFSRGFVEAAVIDAAVFVDRSDEIFRAAPLLSAVTVIDLTGFIEYELDRRVVHREGPDALAVLAQLFDDPHYRRLRGLEIAHAGVRTQHDDGDLGRRGFEGHGDDAIDLMLGKRGFADLRAFGIRGSSLSSNGVREMIARNALASIERLWIRDHPGTDAVVGLLRHAPKLTALDLRSQIKHPQVLPRIPSSVVELKLLGVTETTIDILADCAPQLERLSLHQGYFASRMPDFARFSRLRALDLQDVRFGPVRGSDARDRVFEAFVAQRMPALRELACPSPTSVSQIRLLIDAFGPQLELLDARGEYKIEALADELQARMPGELRVGVWDGNDHPLHVGGRTEPWLDRATIVV
jgi:hypothetical protein